MILNRISTALRSQDWTTVLIEFVLIVLGVLVALEVDRYNERQKERGEEIAFLFALERDIQRDIDDIDELLGGFTAVESFGQKAMGVLRNQGCANVDCWTNLLQIFHSTQWLDVSLNNSTFEEMKRFGLPNDSVLKGQLEQYYALGSRRQALTEDLPEYRRIVRSIVPPDMQRYIWSRCFTVSGRTETYSTECASPATEESVRSVIEQLQQTPEVLTTLTFWLSNVSLTTLTLPQQVEDAEQILVAIRSNIES